MALMIDGEYREKALPAVFYEYAEILGVDNIIKADTIDTTFNNPSGGEEKRLLFLRAILPILHGITEVKVLFCDEITAGLDDANWRKMRKVIDELKLKGLKVVTIDHHDFIPDISFNVQKKETCVVRKSLTANIPNNNCSIFVHKIA